MKRVATAWTTYVGRLALFSLVAVSSFSIVQFIHLPLGPWQTMLLGFFGLLLAVELGLFRWPGVVILNVAAAVFLVYGWYRESAWLDFITIVHNDFLMFQSQLTEGALEQIPTSIGYILVALWIIALGSLAQLGRSGKPFTGTLFLCVAALFIVEWLYETPHVDRYFWLGAVSGLLWLTGQQGYQAARTWLALASIALVIMISWSAPKPSVASGQGNLEKRLEQSVPLLAELKNRTTYLGHFSKPFHLGLTGFAEDESELGGAVTLDPTPVLSLRSRVGYPAVLYLHGSTKSTYNGRGWIDPPEMSQERYSLPGNEAGLWQATNRFTPRRAVALEIELLQPGRTIFYPTALSMFRLPVEHKPWQLAGDVLITQETMAAGSEYTVWYQPSLQRSALNEALTPEEWELFTQLPASLPENVYELAEQITESASNTVEAAMAVQKYLRENYTYTLNATEPPLNRDFVYHFLFEEQQGYCTYFASAMIVLLRTQGIPARWVTGFRINTQDPSAQGSDGRVIVRNQDAHAWVEVWLGPYGWVRFDPTPAGLPEGSEQPLPEEDSDAGEDLLDEPLEEDPLTESDDLAVVETDADEGSAPGEWSSRLRAYGYGLAYWALLPVVAAFFIYRAWQRHHLRKQEKLLQAGGPPAAEASIRLLEQLGKKQGVVRSASETPAEYVERLSMAFPELASLLQAWCRWLERQAYGIVSRHAETENKTIAFDIWQEIQHKLKTGRNNTTARRHV